MKRNWRHEQQVANFWLSKCYRILGLCSWCRGKGCLCCNNSGRRQDALPVLSNPNQTLL